MNYVCAYELVALFLIGLVTFFYHYKNWLPLCRNRCFSCLLHLLLFIIALEIIKRMSELGFIYLSDKDVLVITGLSFIGVVITAVLFWLYYLALTLSLNFLKRKIAIVMFIPAVVMIIFVFMSCFDTGLFYVKDNIAYYDDHDIRIFSIVVIFYILSGAIALAKKRNQIKKKQYIFMQISNIVMICFLELYYIPKKRLMLIYYCVAAVVIIYYFIYVEVIICFFKIISFI